MNPFEYRRAEEADAALEAISGAGSAKFLAGGTNLIDLMKNGVEQPARVVDINHLPLANIEETAGGGLRLGALARNTDTANLPLVRRKYPLLSQAILSGASPQLRNMATNGGNLLQRPRSSWMAARSAAPASRWAASRISLGAPTRPRARSPDEIPPPRFSKLPQARCSPMRGPIVTMPSKLK